MKTDYTVAYYNRGKAYRNIGQYQRAIENFTEAIRLQPDYADAYNSRGLVYGKLGQQQHIIEDFSEVIRLKPNDVNPYSIRGLAYFKQGNNNLGCRDAQKACALGECEVLELSKNEGLCR